MGCGNPIGNQIPLLLSGGIGPLGAIRLRAHLKRCPECRIEMARTQELMGSIRGMASERTGAELKQRIAGSLPFPSQSVQPMGLKEALMTRKRLVIVMAALLISAAALMASQFIGGAGRASAAVTIDGREWRITSDFQGVMALWDSRGTPTGLETGPLGRDQTKGTVHLTVDGARYDFTGIGRHEVRDASGKLLGYVVMGAADVRRLEAQSARSSAQITGDSNGITGVDKGLGMTFSMRGAAKLTFEPAGGGSQMTCASRAKNAAQVPELTVNLSGQTSQFKGYGRHEVTDATGRIVAVFTIDPLQP